MFERTLLILFVFKTPILTLLGYDMILPRIKSVKDNCLMNYVYVHIFMKHINPNSIEGEGGYYALNGPKKDMLM